MYFVVVRNSRTSEWEFYCSADSYCEADHEAQVALDCDGYEDADVWSWEKFNEYFRHR